MARQPIRRLRAFGGMPLGKVVDIFGADREFYEMGCPSDFIQQPRVEREDFS